MSPRATCLFLLAALTGCTSNTPVTSKIAPTDDTALYDDADSCLPTANADTTCDGVDDDCDGETDEDYAASETICGLGACASAGELTCVAGAESDSCVIGEAAASDTTCDEVDDDCDGETDEDYAASETICGLGACASAGELTCVDRKSVV